MKILLTGANGFVGSHIVEELILNNYDVTCIVRKNSNLKWIENQQIKLKYGSLEDKQFLKEVISETDAVIHCAGVVRALEWNVYNEVNVIATKNIIESVLENNTNLKKFIFISSQAAMGPGFEDRMRLISDRENPVSDYGKSKLLAEQEVKKLEGNVPYTIFRPAAVYGPRDKDIFTFFSMVNKHIAPKTFNKHLIQLVFVKDIAKIIIKAINTQTANNKIYYLADGKIYTWKDVADIIAVSNNIKTITVPVFDSIFKIVGSVYEIIGNIVKKPQVLNKEKINEMLQTAWICDNKETIKDMNFEFQNLENGAKITYNWYLTNKWF
ncbi:MAG: NAD(P)-dependent oxidoreductase [Endomicrobiaceae bacterium]|nr:NAD(P)-dependent oxidoreductase [Endomicrobiaceae bacterium]